MNDAQLQAKLTELLALPQETEWAEFKHNNSDPQLIGEYLSAISNSAALESQPFGYIVWGIEDGTHNVIGTSFKPRQQKGQGNEDLEPWLNKLLAPRINFRIFVRLIGQILDPNYTRMLMSQTNLDLLDVIALDKVQKQVPISDEELKSLRARKLVEGRKPNLHVSADVAAATDTMVDYLRRRGIDRDYCQKMILDLLSKGPARRSEIDRLLLDRLSNALDETQRKTFLMNLLQDLRKAELIASEGRGAGSVWQLHSASMKRED
jgi:hypothetical protein